VFNSVKGLLQSAWVSSRSAHTKRQAPPSVTDTKSEAGALFAGLDRQLVARSNRPSERFPSSRINVSLSPRRGSVSTPNGADAALNVRAFEHIGEGVPPVSDRPDLRRSGGTQTSR